MAESFRQIPQCDADILKTASQRLVEKAGGVMAAALCVQTTPSRISEAISPHHATRWLSLLQVAELECVTGQPEATRALARLSGLELSALRAAPTQSWAMQLSGLICHCAKLESGLAEALADGQISPTERQHLERDVQTTLATLYNLQQALRHRKDK